MKAEMGTPWWCSMRNEADGHCLIGAVKRELGWAPRTSLPSSSFMPRCHGRPSQSVASAGGSPSPSSHHTVPSLPSTTFVKMVFLPAAVTALGFDLELVPGATPKKPASGLIAQSRPSVSRRIQAMSSPIVQMRYPLHLRPSGGISIARLVLPHALGKAAATYST